MRISAIILTLSTLLAASPARSESADPHKPDPQTRLGVIHFAAPAQWPATEKPQRHAIAFVSPDSTDDRLAVIVVLTAPAPQADFDFRARFDKAIDSAADGQTIIWRGPVQTGKSRQGCDTLDQRFTCQNSAGRPIEGRMVAARAGNDLAAFCYLATGRIMFLRHADNMVELLNSVSFEGLPPPPATAPATAPSPPTVPIATAPAPAPVALGTLNITDQSPRNAFLRLRYPRHTRLVLTMVPIPAHDGESRTVSCDIDHLPETVQITALPASPQHITAQAITPDSRAWPLKLRSGAGGWATSIEVDPARSPAIGVTDQPR